MSDKNFNKDNSDAKNVPAKKPRLVEPDCDEANSSTDALVYETSESDTNSLSNSSDEDTEEDVKAETSASANWRKFKRTPVYIVDYHNDVLNFIFDCIRSRFMSFKGNTLIHFDSHPDMVIPRELSTKLAFDKISLLNECSIESWIMPLCYTGIITRIVWIKQPCCQQIPLGKHNFNIGSYKDSIYVDFKIPYFLAEAALCATAQLTNQRAIELLVVNDDQATIDLLTTTNEPYILDIDLDFFCTKNPFLNLYTNCDYYDDLTHIFALENAALTECNVMEINERRSKTLNALKKIFVHLAQNDGKLTDYENKANELDAHRFELVETLIAKLLAHYVPQEIDWLQIYDAGCTTDSGGLPAFTATAADLEAAARRFRNIITKLPHDPVLVTISRSSEDEFCPSAQVEQIQALTLRELGNKFTLHKPIRGDLNEDYNIMRL